MRRFPHLVAVEPGMDELRGTIRGCPPALEIAEAGHFVQEWGEKVARAALATFGLTPAAGR